VTKDSHALSMSGSSLIVAVNALLLKRIKLPDAPPTPIGADRQPLPAVHQ
jgi:P-type Cu2+ transporter